MKDLYELTHDERDQVEAWIAKNMAGKTEINHANLFHGVAWGLRQGWINARIEQENLQKRIAEAAEHVQAVDQENHGLKQRIKDLERYNAEADERNQQLARENNELRDQIKIQDETLIARVKEIEILTNRTRNLRWKPIEALPDDIRDGIERVFAIWSGDRFHSFTRSLNRAWLVAGVFTHYFELPTQP